MCYDLQYFIGETHEYGRSSDGTLREGEVPRGDEKGCIESITSTIKARTNGLVGKRQEPIPIMGETSLNASVKSLDFD